MSVPNPSEIRDLSDEAFLATLAEFERVGMILAAFPNDTFVRLAVDVERSWDRIETALDSDEAVAS